MIISACLVAACLSQVAPDGPAAPSETEPGFTMRVFEAPGPIAQLLEPVPGQTPNIDRVIDIVNLRDPDAFGMEDHFVVEVTTTLVVEQAGRYAFQLTSDDGSMLWINDRTVIRNPGLHAAVAEGGSIKLDVGQHALRILYFENEGGEHLELTWRPPNADSFTHVPSSAAYVEAGMTRVTAPGPKRLTPDIAGLVAGDGSPLRDVHPAWRIETIRPADFEPMVGCMAFLPDGRLIVGTFEPRNNGVWLTEPNGTLWALSNLDAADPNDFEVEVFAEDFYHPLGLCVVDGELYVAERDRISRLSDSDGDGVFESRSTHAEGWISNNYHHFTFGLDHVGDHLYATLSTSIGTHGQTDVTGQDVGANGPNPATRGTLMKIALDDGSIEYVAGGFRTPNGILATDDAVYVCDNQGAWMPANRLNHVQAGHFYGHYNDTVIRSDVYPDGGVPALFSDQPPSAPALWLPHNEIANSPTDLLPIDDGPFAGQLLMSDVKLGGIRRIQFDDVAGVRQGAAFRHSQGFEGGTNRLVYGPNGAIYVGCIGERDSWSWNRTRWGLQRMVPTGRTAFEFESVRMVDGDFVLRFTEPVHDDATDPSRYALKQWRYVSAPEYGGPKRDVEDVDIMAVTRVDERTIRLTAPDLTPGRVVHIHADLVSRQGARLHSPEAWYTLNVRSEADVNPAAMNASETGDSPPRVLIFTRTTGFRHNSIPDGIVAFESICEKHGFDAVASEDPELFTDADLAQFDAVVFCNTTGDILNAAQEAAFERWFKAGGAWVGVHSASDTEYDWPFYTRLVGAQFRQHPAIQEATVDVVDRNHPSTRHLDETWVRTDEWYDFRTLPVSTARRLLEVDESTYNGGVMGDDHPIAWCQELDGSRSFYTGGGHTKASYSESDFLRHLEGGLLWTMRRGGDVTRDK